MNKNINLLPVVIVSAAVILSALIFKSTGIYIKSISGAEVNGRVSDTISVSGDGKVTARPDMVELTVSISNLAATSQQSLDKTNQKVSQITQILKNNGLPDTDYQTTGLNIYTEYDYSNSTRRITGQRSTQSLEIKIKKIDDKATKAAKIIDELSAVDNIEINGITFNIEDKTKLYTQARELAFGKAKQKASELANLAGVKLTKPVSISDSNVEVSPVRYSNTAQLKMADSAIGGGTEISTGEMSVSSNIQILWGIE
jgi:hypothetical protein